MYVNVYWRMIHLDDPLEEHLAYGMPRKTKEAALEGAITKDSPALKYITTTELPKELEKHVY
jgi:hypothetical protein